MITLIEIKHKIDSVPTTIEGSHWRAVLSTMVAFFDKMYQINMVLLWEIFLDYSSLLHYNFDMHPHSQYCWFLEWYTIEAAAYHKNW